MHEGSKGHWKNVVEQTVEGQCVKVQICSNWTTEIEEKVPKKSRKKTLENLALEKCLGDKIHEDGTATRNNKRKNASSNYNEQKNIKICDGYIAKS